MAMLTIACEDFTEIAMPETQLASTEAFTDKNTATAVLSDIYARMREGGVASGNAYGLSSLLGNYSDELTFYGENADIKAFNNHTLLPSNSLVSGLWNTTYGQIYAANALLEGLDRSTAIDIEDKDRLRGEALFLRAYLHFQLTNLYGDIPYLRTTNYNTNKEVRKQPQPDVLNAVMADLSAAQALLPENYPTEDRVRSNKAVATALMARVYLYAENWPEAAAAATLVLDDPMFFWEADPANVFLKDSPAIIWALHPGIAGLNTQDARNFVFSFGPPFKPAMSQDLVDAFEPDDLRKQLWTRTITDGTDSWLHAYKYKKTLATPSSQEYTILLRLAEQYLIRAEARAHLGDITGAQQDLDKVRGRAGLPPTTAANEQDLLDAIIRERRVELFCEQGHRWFDLKRTGRANAVLSAIKPNWQPTQVLLPLPESELLLNANLLPQNPGY